MGESGDLTCGGSAYSQPDFPDVSRSDHSSGSKESASWRALGLHLRLTRSIGGSQEGEREERNKRKRQPRQTGAGQRRDWQLNEQREERNMDIEKSQRARAGIEPRELSFFFCFGIFFGRTQHPFSQVLFQTSNAPTWGSTIQMQTRRIARRTVMESPRRYTRSVYASWQSDL